MNEVWKYIDGYEGLYMASSKGRVKSIDRIVTDSRGIKRRFRSMMLKQVAGCGPGYKQVTLSKNNKLIGYLVHRLILETFTGPCPKGMETRHLDGDAGNNCTENLLWGTSTENKSDMKRHKRTCKGERNGNAALTNDERKEILKLHGVLPINRIAELYNVWPSTISTINKSGNY